ncbi:MAG: hypothetical protein AB9Q23_06245 [Candidatus Reddybacter sp.]
MPAQAWVAVTTVFCAKLGVRVILNDLGGTAEGNCGSITVADAVVKEVRDAGGVAMTNYDHVADEQSTNNVI